MRPKQEGARLNAGTRFGPLDRKCRQPYVDCAAPLCVSHSADKPLRKEKGRILHNCREIALPPPICSAFHKRSSGSASLLPHEL